jgi:hypothetical protein
VSARSASLLVVLATLAAVAAFVAAERWIAGAPGLPLDDAWIHLHFARNLAEGAGFSYNPGTPVAGSTAPLWTLVLGGAFALVGPSLLAPKVLGVVLTASAALVSRQAALAWGATPLAATGTAFALVWTAALAWGALSGMEVSLAALLVSAALAAHAHDRPRLVAGLAALAPLARPESAILIPLFALARPPRARRLAVFGAIAALLLAPSMVFNLATTGTPLPATVAAKVDGGLVGWLAGADVSLRRALLERPWQFGREWVGWLAATHWLLPLLIPIGVVRAWRRHGPALGLPALGLVVHPLAMALLAPYRGPGFQEGRYSMHLLPLALVVVAAALPISGRWQRAGIAIYLVVALALLPRAAERYGWAVQNINAMQVHLGHWVDSHVPPRARLALNDVGAIAYVSRRQVIDLMGLVTPEIAPYRRRGEAGVIDFVSRTCPDFVIVFPAWFPDLTARRSLLEPIYAVRLARNVVAGGPEMVVYRVIRCAL